MFLYYFKESSDSDTESFETVNQLAARICVASDPSGYRGFEAFSEVVRSLQSCAEASTAIFSDKPWMPEDSIAWFGPLPINLTLVDPDDSDIRHVADRDYTNDWKVATPATSAAPPKPDRLAELQEVIAPIETIGVPPVRPFAERSMRGGAGKVCFVIDTITKKVMKFTKVSAVGTHFGVHANFISTLKNTGKLLKNRWRIVDDYQVIGSIIGYDQPITVSDMNGVEDTAAVHSPPVVEKPKPPVRRGRLKFVRVYSDPNGKNIYCTYMSANQAIMSLKLPIEKAIPVISNAEPDVIHPLPGRPSFSFKVEY